MLALYQGAPAFADPRANLARVDDLAGAAAAAGSRLLVLPELFLTGYNIKDTAAELAEPRDGPIVRGLSRIAAGRGLALVAGFPERAGSTVHNTCVAVGPDGTPLAFYRKIHLFGGDESRVFTPGDGLAVLDLPTGRTGLCICYDIEFPEVARALARAGAQTILVPTANMAPYWDVPTTLVRARALENGLAVVYANLCGTEGELDYTGLSGVVGPDGRDRARAGPAGPALLTVGLDDLHSPAAPLSSQLDDLHPDRLRIDAADARP